MQRKQKSSHLIIYEKYNPNEKELNLCIQLLS